MYNLAVNGNVTLAKQNCTLCSYTTVCDNTHNIIPIFNNESYKDIGGDSCICTLMAVSKSLGDIFSAI